MPNLYIANTSTQDHVFHWTLPENAKIFSMPIKAGGQIQVVRDGLESHIDYIVGHHKKYGLVSIAEAKKAGKTSNKISLVYSEKPIPLDVFGIADEVNQDIVAEQIQRNKEETAYGLIKSIETNPDLREGVKAVELEIIEDTPKENDRKGKTLVKQKFRGDIKS
jgi:hypothetical protein